VIEVKNLTKNYGSHRAVSDLSFTAEGGKVYGFLGPNGAGKSTTMNMITGCLAATEGTVTIDGFDIFEDNVEAKKRIGYLPELPPVFGDMTVMEYLQFVAEAKKVKLDEKILKQTGVDDVSDRLIKNLSKGYRQRVGIAQALVGDPSIIILDEPTVGLDPQQIMEIRSLIRNLGKKHTVILSSHILSEVQAVCDEILIISGGKLVACDTPENLESLFSASTQIEATAECDRLSAQKILSGILGVDNVKCIEKGAYTEMKLQCKNNDNVTKDIFFAFAKENIALTKLVETSLSLEQIFIELTKGEEKNESYI